MNKDSILSGILLLAACIAGTSVQGPQNQQVARRRLPNGHMLAGIPGEPKEVNTLPTALAASPDHRYIAILNSGYGGYRFGQQQSIAILDVAHNTITDFPDQRLAKNSRQTYFVGLAFSPAGDKLYASMGSLTDPLGEKAGDTGNGIAVYRFHEGQIAPSGFLRIAPRKNLPAGKARDQEYAGVTFPAGLAAFRAGNMDELLIASNVSDEAVLLEAGSGAILHRFDLSVYSRIPASFPYGVAVSGDGSTGYVSLWNASRVAEIDLRKGVVRRMIPVRLPSSPTVPGSHPCALLLSAGDRRLYVTLSNSDEVAVIDPARGSVRSFLSTRLPGQDRGGSAPNALTLSADGGRLFVANAVSDSVAVFAIDKSAARRLKAIGFIPTEWFPTALLSWGDDLFIAAGKGQGSGANGNPLPLSAQSGRPREYPYIPAMTYGSLARISLHDLAANLGGYTEQALTNNLMRGNFTPGMPDNLADGSSEAILFPSRKNPIKHVIYVIKENRSYDQILGDLGAGNGDPSLTMFGEEITPNQHRLARQFGVLDNFYDSGDVSGNGHVWSTAGTVTDYLEKTWPIAYRGRERSYDYEGEVMKNFPLQDGNPDVDEPSSGYLWGNFARHKVTYRHYGEFISSQWCNAPSSRSLPMQGTPHPAGRACPKTSIHKGEPLPANVGQPHGSPSPYPWPIPILAGNIATKAELVGHFDPLFPDFETSFPDQLRMDEFLNEFSGFVAARNQGRDAMPQFILLRLPNDHTAGVRQGRPSPAASVADNDLAVGRLAEAVSHSAYWEDTAIFILEDDAQDGADHVDAHRSTAFVISKYAPGAQREGRPAPFVDSTYYNTLSMIHTMEALLHVPAMNNGDARATLMAALFSGAGTQQPYQADRRNQDNGLIYQANERSDAESLQLDFSHADAADAQVLNRVLWRNRMGARPMPTAQGRQ